MSHAAPFFEPRIPEEAIGRRFANLAMKLGGKPELVASWHSGLMIRYRERQRHYHTFRILNSMLLFLDQCATLVDDPAAVELAVYFQYWIYNPACFDNEVRTLETFDLFAKDIGFPDALKHRVMRLIDRRMRFPLLINRDMVGEAKDARLFADFELEVLSRPEEEYETYADQIREEFRFYSGKEYRVRRTRFLQDTLGRETIYFSGHFPHLEDQARKNMRMEMKNLEERLG